MAYQYTPINSPINSASLATEKARIQGEITKLNDIENSLRQLLDNPALSSNDKLTINNKLTALSNIKLSLNAQLTNLYSLYDDNLGYINNVINTQKTAIDIIDSETVDNNKRLDMLLAQKNDKIRLLQNNTYYGKYYQAQKKIMMTVVFITLPVLFLIGLGNMGLIPSNLKALLIIIIVILGCISIGYQVIDLSNRDNMNFDEYNWRFDKNLAPKIKVDGVTPFDPWSTLPSNCPTI